MNPRLKSWPLLASLCAILALMAVPTPGGRSRPGDESFAPLRQIRADAARGGDARFDAPRARPAAPRPESARLWRRLMLERALAERAARFGPLFYAFPSISDARSSAAAAPGEPFGAEPVEASAPLARVVGRGNVVGVWEGATVPLESLDAPSRWLTPSVGRVRAELADGTAFEGRLHSLGEGKVWIENELGRMALLGSQIRTLRQLPPLPSAASADPLPALPLVRVRTPGGIFQGRLLRREEGRVTLLTAEGGQVTLDEAELEPVRPETTIRRP
jgi:hypothetical protein